MRLLPLPGVFRPPSDSWLLARRIAAESLDARSSVLDLCTGSGILAIAAARRSRSRDVMAVDISLRAVVATRLNARLNRCRVHAVHGDLYEPVGERRFDLIVSNPPYVPTPEADAPPGGLARAWAAGPDGRLFIDRVCDGAPEHLRSGGALMIVHSSICGERATLNTLTARGLRADVVERRRGGLGPLMRSQLPRLRALGLVSDDESEEMVVIRAQN